MSDMHLLIHRYKLFHSEGLEGSIFVVAVEDEVEAADKFRRNCSEVCYGSDWQKDLLGNTIQTSLKSIR